MKVKFGSWNLNRRVKLTDHIRLLESEQCDIVALQGVKWKALKELMDMTSYHSSWPLIDGEFALDPCTCVLLCRMPFQVRPIDQTISVRSASRAVIATIQHPTGQLAASSLQVPYGSDGNRQRKLDFIQEVVNWLTEQAHTVIVGLSANSPKIDHPSHEQNVWWSNEEAALLGHSPAHPLRDVLREYYRTHPNELEEVAKVRPYGPLAASYVEHGAEETQRRYDFILATPDCLKEIANVRYIPYRDANGDGKPDLQPIHDHAFVVAELDVP